MSIDSTIVYDEVRKMVIDHFRNQCFSPLQLSMLLDNSDSCSITLSAIESIRKMQKLKKFSHHSLLQSKSVNSSFMKTLSLGANVYFPSLIFEKDNFSMIKQLPILFGLITACGSDFNQRRGTYR